MLTRSFAAPFQTRSGTPRTPSGCTGTCSRSSCLERREPGGDRRAEAFAAWRRFLEALAAQRPLILVLEDVHWADDTLLDFVEYLVEWAAGAPLFLLATTRPELLDRRPAWSASKPSVVTLMLAPLSDEETTRLSLPSSNARCSRPRHRQPCSRKRPEIRSTPRSTFACSPPERRR